MFRQQKTYPVPPTQAKSTAVAAASAVGKLMSPNGRNIDRTRIPLYNSPSRSNSMSSVPRSNSISGMTNDHQNNKRYGSLTRNSHHQEISNTKRFSSHGHTRTVVRSPSSSLSSSSSQRRSNAAASDNSNNIRKSSVSRRTSSLPAEVHQQASNSTQNRNKSKNNNRRSSITRKQQQDAQDAFQEFGGPQTSDIIYNPSKPKTVKKYIPGPHGLVAVEVPVGDEERRRNRGSYSLTANYSFVRRSNSIPNNHHQHNNSNNNNKHSSPLKKRINSLTDNNKNVRKVKNSPSSSLKKNSLKSKSNSDKNIKNKKHIVYEDEIVHDDPDHLENGLAEENECEDQYNNSTLHIPMIESSMPEETELELELENEQEHEPENGNGNEYFVNSNLNLELNNLLAENIQLERQLGTPVSQQKKQLNEDNRQEVEQGQDHQDNEELNEEQEIGKSQTDLESRDEKKEIKQDEKEYKEPQVILHSIKYENEYEDHQSNSFIEEKDSTKQAVKNIEDNETREYANSMVKREEEEDIQHHKDDGNESDKIVNDYDVKSNISNNESKLHLDPNTHNQENIDTNESILSKAASSIYDDENDNKNVKEGYYKTETIKPIVLDDDSFVDQTNNTTIEMEKIEDSILGTEPLIKPEDKTSKEATDDMLSESSSYMTTQEEISIGSPEREPEIPPISPRRLRSGANSIDELTQTKPSITNKNTVKSVTIPVTKQERVKRDAIPNNGERNTSMAGYLRSANPYLIKNNQRGGDHSSSVTPRKSQKNSLGSPTKLVADTIPLAAKGTMKSKADNLIPPPKVQNKSINSPTTPIKSALKKSHTNDKRNAEQLGSSAARGAYLSLATAENTRLNAQISVEKSTTKKTSKRITRPPSTLSSQNQQHHHQQQPAHSAISPIPREKGLKKNVVSNERPPSSHLKRVKSSTSKRSSKIENQKTKPQRRNSVDRHAEAVKMTAKQMSNDPNMQSYLYPREPPQRKSSFEKMKTTEDHLGFKKLSLRNEIMADAAYEQSGLNNKFHKNGPMMGSGVPAMRQQQSDSSSSFLNAFSSRFQDSDSDDEFFGGSGSGSGRDTTLRRARSSSFKDTLSSSGNSPHHKGNGFSLFKSKKHASTTDNFEAANAMASPQNAATQGNNSMSSPLRSKNTFNNMSMRAASVSDKGLVSNSRVDHVSQQRVQSNPEYHPATNVASNADHDDSKFGQKLKKIFGRKK